MLLLPKPLLNPWSPNLRREAETPDNPLFISPYFSLTPLNPKPYTLNPP